MAAPSFRFIFIGLFSEEKADTVWSKIMSVTTDSPVYQWIKEGAPNLGLS